MERERHVAYSKHVKGPNWPNIRLEDGDTPLLSAVRHELGDPRPGSNGGVLVLLKSGADPNITNISGQFPLLLASSRLKVAVAEELLRHNANPNQAHDPSGLSPIHVAASNGNVRLLNLLISYNVNLHAKDDFGRTAMRFAAAKGSSGSCLFLYLLSHFSFSVCLYVEFVEVLLQRGAVVTWSDVSAARDNGFASLANRMNMYVCLPPSSIKRVLPR